MVFRHLKKTPFIYGNNNALLEISSAHNFDACTNVSCILKLYKLSFPNIIPCFRSSINVNLTKRVHCLVDKKTIVNYLNMRNVNMRGNYVYMLHDIIYVACQHKNQTCIVGTTVKWLKY